MSWERRILPVDAMDFRASVQALIRQQLKTWPMLREAVAGLKDVEYKKLNVKGSEVFAQFNPKRIVSTGAKVDPATIEKRPCFLCAENLPAEEMGVPFGDHFVTLCNPFPVLPNHLVISSRRHRPQTIEGNFATLLDLARDLGEEWFTLYNGPRCGASAPDHLHFQAASCALLPILHEVEVWPDSTRVISRGVEVIVLRNYRLNALIARSACRGAMISWFERVLGSLAAIANRIEEPMINLVTRFSQNEWTTICYPRSRHRPSCYDAEGEAKLTVSPAAIDLSGILVVPNPDHFVRITAGDVEQIYSEVTFGMGKNK